MEAEGSVDIVNEVLKKHLSMKVTFEKDLKAEGVKTSQECVERASQVEYFQAPR